MSTPNADNMTTLEQVFHDGLFEAIALKMVARWDMPPNWFVRPPRMRSRLTSSFSSTWEQNKSVPMSYLYQASYLHWLAVEELILNYDPSQALTLDYDNLSFLKRYAYHGV